LLRNPLAVLNSVIETWIGADMFRLREFRGDLMLAPRLLVEGMQLLADKCQIIQYERLVTDPASVIEPVCQWLGIEFVPAMIEYGRDLTPQFSLGDHKSVYRHSRPDSSHRDGWCRHLADAQAWRLTRDYLRELGPDTIEALGYSFQQSASELEQQKPRNYQYRPTLSLESCLGERTWWKSCWGYGVRLERALRRKGVGPTVAAAARRIAGALLP
jgi:hypothetical protein